MNPATRLMVLKLESLAAGGMSYAEAAEEIGAGYHYVARLANKHAIAFRECKRGRPAVTSDPRAENMRDRYAGGETLEQIGQAYGITRERVRQIMTKYFGTKADDGGKAEKGRQARKEFQRKRDLRSLKAWGCNFREYRRILDHQGKPTYAFWAQRKNAIKREIGWDLNLWQWWKIWEQSGHWSDRGRGHGYGMCRLNDIGPYAIDNVYIATGSENMQDYWVNKRAANLEAAA